MSQEIFYEGKSVLEQLGEVCQCGIFSTPAAPCYHPACNLKGNIFLKDKLPPSSPNSPLRDEVIKWIYFRKQRIFFWYFWFSWTDWCMILVIWQHESIVFFGKLPPRSEPFWNFQGIFLRVKKSMKSRMTLSSMSSIRNPQHHPSNPLLDILLIKVSTLNLQRTFIGLK